MPPLVLRQHIQSDGIRRGMPSSLLDRIHDRPTLGVACHHVLWPTHTVGRRPAWHAIIALVLHTQTDKVESGMQKSPLCNTYNETTSGNRWHHCSWVAHTDRRCRTSNRIIPLGKHTRSEDVEHGMPSSPLENTQSDKIRCGMPSCSLGSTHGRTMLAMEMPSSPLLQLDCVVCGTPSSPLDSIHKVG